jgi:hypothetical protein
MTEQKPTHNADYVARLEARDEAWKRLVQHLITERGFAPDWKAKGLWVDLYDEATKDWDREPKVRYE